MEDKKFFSILNSLQRYKPLTVEWLDASTTKNAIIQFPLPNYYVETRRRTTGAFLCLQKGSVKKSWHLILELDNTDELGSSIRSIPLSLITEIVVDGEKYTECIEKRVIKNKDGSIKYI